MPGRRNGSSFCAWHQIPRRSRNIPAAKKNNCVVFSINAIKLVAPGPNLEDVLAVVELDDTEDDKAVKREDDEVCRNLEQVGHPKEHEDHNHGQGAAVREVLETQIDNNYSFLNDP